MSTHKEIDRVARLLHQAWLDFAVLNPTTCKPNSPSYDQTTPLARAAYRHAAKAVILDQQERSRQRPAKRRRARP